MQKILISWIAYNHDFVFHEGEGMKVNPNGTHGELYEYLNNYDLHYLLVTPDKNKVKDDTKIGFLENFLNRQGKSEVVIVPMSITDPTDVIEIKNVVHEFLLTLKEHQLEIFVSPGTPAMQTAWYLIASEFKFNSLFFKTKAPQHRKTLQPVKEPFEIEKSNYSKGIILKKIELDAQHSYPIFKPKKLQIQYDLAIKAASHRDASVLIYGNTGTGKELMANFIHENSSRSKNKFLPINCAAFSPDLLESRLFGHVKGAFTHANSNSKGAFLEANGGTLFLDEIGDMSMSMQQALLRVLEEKKVYPVGSYDFKEVNVRIVAATHKNLWKLVEQGSFRQDLYYRLAMVELNLPTLKEYSSRELKTFINFWLDEVALNWEVKRIELNADVMAFLLNHDFSGNIRELQNLIKGWYALCDEVVTIKDIPERMHRSVNNDSLDLVQVGNQHILRVMRMFPDNKNKVCKALGMSFTGLEKRIKRHALVID